MITHNIFFYVLMSTDNICFYGEISIIIPKLSPKYPPYLFDWNIAMYFCIVQ